MPELWTFDQPTASLVMKAIIAALLAPMAAIAVEKDAEKVCRDFLAVLPAVHFASTGVQTNFKGTFTKIDPELDRQLRTEFPKLTFHIADMEFIHWGPEPVHLLLVTDQRSGSVCTYVWDVWFADIPFSFGAVFAQREGLEPAKRRMELLGRLLAQQMGWTVGSTGVEKSVVIVPLIDRNNAPWRYIRCPTEIDLTSLDRLDIVHPSKIQTATDEPRKK